MLLTRLSTIIKIKFNSTDTKASLKKHLLHKKFFDFEKNFFSKFYKGGGRDPYQSRKKISSKSKNFYAKDVFWAQKSIGSKIRTKKSL
jgi:hypothetical protein